MRTLLLLLLFTALLGSRLGAQVIEAPFSADYHLVELGPVPGIPGNLGGLTLRRDLPSTLYVVGQATQAPAAVYRIRIARDGVGHITGFDGSAAFHAATPDADGGLQFGPGGVLFFTRYNMNELGQVRPGSVAMDKSIPLFPLGVSYSVGGLQFVPYGLPRARDLTLVCFNRSTTYTATLLPDGSGTYDIGTVTPGATLSGGPEGYVYVPPRSPQFTDYGHVLVCEWSAYEVAAYELDANGDPDASSRQVLLSGLPGCEGAVIDPLSGDLLISVYGTNRVYAVRGFGSWHVRAFARTPSMAPEIQLHQRARSDRGTRARTLSRSAE